MTAAEGVGTAACGRAIRPGSRAAWRADSFRFFLLLSCDGHRKRRKKPLPIRQGQPGDHGLLGEDVVGKHEVHLQTGQNDFGEDSRDQDAGEQAGEDDEEQIVSRVERRHGDDGDQHQVDGAFARELELDFHHPALERRAPRQVGNHLDRDDSRQDQRNGRSPEGRAQASIFSQSRGVDGEEECEREGEKGEKKASPRRPVNVHDVIARK